MSCASLLPYLLSEMTGEAGESNGFAEAGKKSMASQRGGKSTGVFADKNKTERKKISPVIEPLF